jgi:regulator of sigma E protease
VFYALAAIAIGLLYSFGFLIPAMALAFLIVVHESGHYFVARWCGMKVERFSIGFGPAIPGFKYISKSGTQFQLAPLPFGGFVEIRGMNIMEEVEPDDHAAYPNRPTWMRFLTIFAGPATNYISAIFLAFGLFMCHGVDTKERYYTVAEVMDGFDASAKLQKNDRLLSVDGNEIYTHRDWKGPTISSLVNAKKGGAVVVGVRRDGKIFDVTIQPKLGYRGDLEYWFAGVHEGVNKHLLDAPMSARAAIIVSRDRHKRPQQLFLLGILYSSVADVVDVGFFDSVKRALVYPVDQTKVIGEGLYKIVTREAPADPGGPIRIMNEFKKAYEEGWVDFIRLLMMLSVYLGLFNLLPLPALDGGRLVFLTYELVTRRRANAKIEATVHMAGIMIILVAMILVFAHDCRTQVF